MKRQSVHRHHDARKAVGFGGVVGGPELQDYLVLLAEVQGLKVPAVAQVPNVNVVPVAARE
jgi:hypothetical protein